MIKKLAGSVREYKKLAILAPIFVFLEVVLDTLIPYYMAKLIDNGVEKGDMNYILKVGIFLVVLTAVALLCGALSAKFASVASTGFAKNLRHDMFYNLQEYSFENIDRISTGSIITRLTTDVSRVQQSFQMIIRIAVRSPLNLICALVMAFKIDSKLSLIFLIAIPILGVTISFIAMKAHPILKAVFKIYDKLNTFVQENLYGVRVVKSFVREDYQTNKFKEISQSIYEGFISAEKIFAFNAPTMQLVVNSCMLLLSWFGAKFIVAGEMTTGNLTSLLSYTMQILSALMMFSMVFVMVTMSRASGERIVEVLEEKPTITDCENPVYEVKDGSIKFDNVNFSYSNDMNRLSLKDINLEIKSGETIGILGGTGSSKSTLVQLISRLYDVTSGSVKVGGIDVREYDIPTLRDSVSVVLQKNVLFSGTINENLRWGNPDATEEEIIHACKLAQAHDFIESFPDKYETYIEQGGSNVSGGQKQRLCIARALLKKPKILILDDSTSAVDAMTDSLIRKAFREYIPETTKLIIAQRINSISDADRIIVMNEGKVDAFGTHEELLATNEIYQQVYNSQMQGGTK